MGGVCFWFKCTEWEPQSHVEWLASGCQTVKRQARRRKEIKVKTFQRNQTRWSEVKHISNREIHHKESLSETRKKLLREESRKDSRSPRGQDHSEERVECAPPRLHVVPFYLMPPGRVEFK